MFNNTNFEYDEECRRFKVSRRNPYSNFESVGSGIYEMNLMEKGCSLNVSDLIRDAVHDAKILYARENFSMKWEYEKRNGKHGKDNGYIKVRDNKTLLAINVEKGRAKKIIIYGEKAKEKIEMHKDMPLHKEITDLLS